MNLYQGIKDFGKRALLVGGLAAVLSGCARERTINQIVDDMELFEMLHHIQIPFIHVQIP